MYNSLNTLSGGKSCLVAPGVAVPPWATETVLSPLVGGWWGQGIARAFTRCMMKKKTICNKFVFDLSYVIGQTSFMSIYISCGKLVLWSSYLCLKGSCVESTYTFFLSFQLLLLLLGLYTSALYTTHSIWHLLLKGAVFFLNTVTIWGFSNFISLKLFWLVWFGCLMAYQPLQVI